VKRRKLIGTVGSSVLCYSAFSTIQKPVVGLDFQIKSIPDKDPSKTDSILFEFEDINIIPEYLDTSEDLKVRIELEIGLLDEIISKEKLVKFENGNKIPKSKFVDSDQSKDLSFIYVDGLNISQNYIDGSVRIIVNHKDINEIPYESTFRIDEKDIFVPDSGIHRWEFENISNGEASDIWYGKSATVSGATTSSGSDKTYDTKNALYFDSSTTGSLGNIPEVYGTDEMSISFWVNTNSSTDRTKILKVTDGSDSMQFRYLADRGSFDWVVSNGSAGSNEPTRDTSSVANEWYHIVGTFYPGYIEIYYNTNWDSTDISTSNTPNLDGYEFKIATDNFDGYIDDIRFYNRRLESSEVDDLYTNGKI
jgi:hypothetical protein